uniref:Uncharacterized protein n=1 Tax=Anguilla anguilla TaxID=7936 RepID=A0A0E9TX82_ANGAN
MQKERSVNNPTIQAKYTLYITITTFKPGVKGVNDHNTQNSAVINAFKTTKNQLLIFTVLFAKVDCEWNI